MLVLYIPLDFLFAKRAELVLIKRLPSGETFPTNNVLVKFTDEKEDKVVCLADNRTIKTATGAPVRLAQVAVLLKNAVPSTSTLGLFPATRTHGKLLFLKKELFIARINCPSED